MNPSPATGPAPGRAPSRYGGFGEFCTIVAGRLTLAGDAQVPQTFRPGYCFTIPAGWAGTRTVREPRLKLVAATRKG